MKETSLRQSFLGEDSDDVLSRLVVGIVGLGGAGSNVVQQLSHIGVGNMILVDPDKVEFSNLNRLVGATYQDAEEERLKTDVAARVANGIQPGVNVMPHPKPWREAIEDLRDADVIVGCVDSYLERSQLEAFARRYLIPYIDIGMDVHEVGDHFVIAGQIALSMPGRVCLLCMALITDDDLAKESYGAAGGRPQVVWPNGLLASAAVGLLAELVTPWFKPGPQSALLRYDGNGQTLTVDNWFALNGNRECQHYPLGEVGDPHAFWIRSSLARLARKD